MFSHGTLFAGRHDSTGTRASSCFWFVKSSLEIRGESWSKGGNVLYTNIMDGAARIADISAKIRKAGKKGGTLKKDQRKPGNEF